VAGGYRYCLEYLDFTYQASDQGLEFGLRLDRLARGSSANYSSVLDQTQFVIPYIETGDVVVVTSTPEGDAQPTVQFPAQQVVNYTSFYTSIVVKGDQSAKTIWAGRPYRMSYIFSEISTQDGQGTPVMSFRLRLKHMLLKYTKTGFFKVLVTPFLRDTYTYPFAGMTTGDALGSAPLDSGILQVPIGSTSEGTTIEIQSDSYYPVTVPYAEWVGEIINRPGRN
jgi:hypothetical protein